MFPSALEIDTQTVPRKWLIVSMGGKGGVGKTNFRSGLAECYQDQRIPVTLLDLDTENKTRGSLTHFFGGHVPKINVLTWADHLQRARQRPGPRLPTGVCPSGHSDGVSTAAPRDGDA